MPPERAAAIALPSAPSTSGTTAAGRPGMSAGSNNKNTSFAPAALSRTATEPSMSLACRTAQDRLASPASLPRTRREERLGVPFRQVEIDDDGDFLADERGNCRGLRAFAASSCWFGTATVSSRAIGIERNMGVLHQSKSGSITWRASVRSSESRKDDGHHRCVYGRAVPERKGSPSLRPSDKETVFPSRDRGAPGYR